MPSLQPSPQGSPPTSRLSEADRRVGAAALLRARNHLVLYHGAVNGWEIPDHQAELCRLWQEVEATPDAPALPTVVAMAVGIVMHRFSLARGPALERLQRLSVQEGRALERTCTAMVEALEQLALPGSL